MKKPINNVFLTYASDILADTNTGLTSTEIGRCFSAKSLDYNVDIPFHKPPFEAVPNKRTAFLENLKRFNSDQQFEIIPDPSDYKNFPLFSEASFPLIIEGIHKHNGLCLVVYPDADNYKGNLYILTNKRTASTCEPLVYGLKQNKRATIVGERTAGAMLNGERFELQDKFNLWMPTADYYTVDGNKIDKTGVEPHIAVMSDAALDKALEIINGRTE